MIAYPLQLEPCAHDPAVIKTETPNDLFLFAALSFNIEGLNGPALSE
jgi:hypothetical protein